MRRSISVGASWLAVLLSNPGAAHAEARLVRDVWSTPDVRWGSSVLAVTRTGASSLYIADDGIHGHEPWLVPGPDEPARMVADIRPGPSPSIDTSLDVDEFVSAMLRGRFYFAADDGVHGRELWASDGSEAGTRMVVDLTPGWRSSAIVNIVVGADPWIYFVIGDMYGRGELWRTDGTPLGTSRVELEPDLVVKWAAAIDSRLLASGWESGSHDPFLVSVASSGVVTRIADVDVSSGGAVVDGIAHFAAQDAVHGQEPWRSDGTPAGTWLLRDIEPGSAASRPSGFQPLGSSMVFIAAGRLWITDGSTSGTRVATEGATPEPTAAADIAVMSGQVIFTAVHPASGRELWRSDGTAGGTSLIKDITIGPGSTTLDSLRPAGGRVVFNKQSRLWASDGTAAGTREIHPPDLRLASFGDPWRTLAVDMGDRVHFVGDGDFGGQEPWVTDGTRAGTRPLADIAVDPGSGMPRSLCDTGGRLAFTSMPTQAMWQTDGTFDGTAVLLSHSTTPAITLPDDLFLGPSGLLFHEWSRAARGLHVTDGTAEGTHLLATVDGASARFVTSGGRVAFVASDAAHGCEVRTTDGTPEGTALLKDAAAGAQDGIFDVPVTHWQSEHFRSRPLDLDGRLLFSAGSPSRAWVSDGTQAGTMLLQPTDGSTGPLIPHAWATHGSSAFFLAGDEGYELHLWRTDGTSESTTSLALLRFHCPLPSGWLVSDGRRLFALVRAVRGKQVDLFTSDGTSAGTTYLRSFPEAGTDDRMNNDPLPELPALVPLEGGGVLFVANDGDHGREPWFSDGTLSGTRLVADIVPGPHGSEPHELARFGRWVVFAARDEAHGVEPWATDGTQDRTVRLADVERGIEPSLPREFTLSGGLVYFSARDAVHGRELWAMRLDTDDDGMLDVTDPCPDVADAGADSDADGAGDACDAAPADASVQALPREVRSLDVASQSGGVRLTWENQSDETGVGVRYDVLEGALGPGSLTPTTCVVRDMAETLADVAATGSRWWLVRARAAGFTATYGSSLADGLGDCN